jgi:ABC-2 type transport system ATP-binding protein
MTDLAVSVQSFVKRYGDATAVDGISFDVTPGEVFGLLGPNGAGKTTTFECLEGLRRPTDGELRVYGVDPEHDPARLARLIGVQLQASGLPATMTPVDAIRFFAAYHRHQPQMELLDRFGLGPVADRQYVQLSTGLQRRLSLALAIAHDPSVLILDEPTAGLDVASRAELHSAIRQLSDSGTTILLATHDMAEAEALSDRVAILLRGEIVAMGSPRELTTTGGGMTKVSVRTERMGFVELPQVGAVSMSVVNGYAVAFTENPGPLVAAILEHAAGADDSLVDLRVERPSLEERFLELTRVET